MRKITTPLILLATCLLALGPLCIDWFGPASQARWLLALAANQHHRSQTKEAQATLARALQISPTIASDAEYWSLRFQFLFDQKKVDPAAVDALAEECEASLEALPPFERVRAALFISEKFHRNKRLDLSIRMMERFFPPIDRRTPGQNNNLAYYRALDNTSLELALQEINAALKVQFDPTYLDTKAWVLHRLHQNAKALPFAEQSLQLFYAAIQEGNKELYQLLYPDSKSSSDEPREAKVDENAKQDDDVADTDAAKDSQSHLLTESESKAEGPQKSDKKSPSSPSPESEDPIGTIKRKTQLDPTLIDELVKSIAVMRYHRACILDALGRDDESDRDYRWLDRFGFTDTKILQ